MMKARRMLMASLAKPGFLSGFINQAEAENKGGIDRQAALAEFAGQLASIGIAQEEAFRAFAA